MTLDHLTASARLIHLLAGHTPPGLSRLPEPWLQLARAAAAVPPAPALRLAAIRPVLTTLSDASLALLDEHMHHALLRSIKPTLTQRQLELLAALESHGPAQVGALARLLKQDRSNTFRRLKRLVARGLVRRLHLSGAVYYQPILKDIFAPTTTYNTDNT